MATTDARKVRLLIPDTEAIYGEGSDETLFSDEDIEAFLELGSMNPKWAAGLACKSVGGSEALILKVIKNYETSTNGAVLMREWLRKGAELIAEGKEEAQSGDFSYFEIIRREPVLGLEGEHSGLWRW